MDFGNIVVLVVTIIAVIYSLMRSARGAARGEPEDAFEEEEEVEERLRAPHPHGNEPPPPPQLQTGPRRELPPEKRFATEKFIFHTKLDDFKTKTAIDDRTLQIGLHTPDEIISDAVRLAETEGTLYKRKKAVLVRRMLQQLPHKKLLWLSHEIVASPVSRRLPFPWNR